MSFAVIKTGGKQYKVKSGEILKIEKLTDVKANSKIEFNEKSLKVKSLDIINLAKSEGLHSHANSVEIRFED